MALFGFGVDPFVQVISDVGIWHMVRRIRSDGSKNLDQFEPTGLKIIGKAGKRRTIDSRRPFFSSLLRYPGPLPWHP